MSFLRNNSKKIIRKLWWLPCGVALLALFSQVIWQNPESVRAAGIDRPTVTSLGPRAPSAGGKVYLPFIKGGFPHQTQAALLGIYNAAYYGSGAVVDQYLTALDTWAGLNRSSNKGHALSGDFIDIDVGNPAYNIPVPLENLWQKGYTDFINLNTNRSAANIASGGADVPLRAWADAYFSWVRQGGGRKAFIAPLPEMNGDWVPFGCDAPNYKTAYLRIQSIFAAAGVTRSQVWWVFPPNGWSTPCNGYTMHDYYPGDAKVDIIGFSAYNQSCLTGRWEAPDQVFGPWIDDIRNNVSSSKPIFVTQTGTTASAGDRDQWLRDAYSYLAVQNIRAILYFNMTSQCDWRVFTPDGSIRVQGYKDAASTSSFRYYPAGLTGWTPNP